MSDEPLSQEEIDKLLQAVLSKEAHEEPQAKELAGDGRHPSAPGAPAVLPTGADPGPDNSKGHGPQIPDLGAWAPLAGLQLAFTAEIGGARLSVGDVMQFGVGSRIALKSRWTEPLLLKLNGKAIGRGRVVLVGNKFGVQVMDWGQQ